jgi:hypothetical protein
MTDQNQPKFYTVAIYMEDRAFGGPEEGGWYYDTAELCMEPEAAQFLRGFNNEEEATEYALELNAEVMPVWNEGGADISSVLSEGRYAAIVSEGMPKPHYPEETPRYE